MWPLNYEATSGTGRTKSTKRLQLQINQVRKKHCNGLIQKCAAGVGYALIYILIYIYMYSE